MCLASHSYVVVKIYAQTVQGMLKKNPTYYASLVAPDPSLTL